MNKQGVVAVAIAWCVIIALIFGAMHIPGVLAIIVVWIIVWVIICGILLFIYETFLSE